MSRPKMSVKQRKSLQVLIILDARAKYTQHESSLDRQADSLLTYSSQGSLKGSERIERRDRDRDREEQSDKLASCVRGRLNRAEGEKKGNTKTFIHFHIKHEENRAKPHAIASRTNFSRGKGYRKLEF